MLNAADLPDDIAALKAMLIAATAREVRKDERIERLERLVAAFRQAVFGRRSEKANPDQFDLALEDLETAIAAVQAEDEADTSPSKRVSKPRATNRGSLPDPNIIYRVIVCDALTALTDRGPSTRYPPLNEGPVV